MNYKFEDYGANQAMIDSTLDGVTPGDVLDDLVVTSFGFCFGSIEKARSFSQEKNRTLGLVSVNKLDAPEKCVQRREYLDISPKDPGVNSIFSIGTFDPEKSNWKGVVAAIWGSFENYCRHGRGVGIFDGSNQIAEAMVGFPGKKYWEIGTITHESYRGKGLSSLASYLLVRELVKDGISPSWSCNEDNPASYRVAEKIGFTTFRTYYFYVISPN